MLMIDHFFERETKLLEISKRGEEKFLNSNVRRILLGGYFAISHLLHALSAILLCLLHRERVVTSTYVLSKDFKQYTFSSSKLLMS